MSSKEIEERKVATLLSKLTLNEKFKLLTGYFFFQTHRIPRLGIKTFKVTDGPLGISQHSSFLRKNTYFPAGINLADLQVLRTLQQGLMQLETKTWHASPLINGKEFKGPENKIFNPANTNQVVGSVINSEGGIVEIIYYVVIYV